MCPRNIVGRANTRSSTNIHRSGSLKIRLSQLFDLSDSIRGHPHLDVAWAHPTCHATYSRSPLNPLLLRSTIPVCLNIHCIAGGKVRCSKRFGETISIIWCLRKTGIPLGLSQLCLGKCCILLSRLNKF